MKNRRYEYEEDDIYDEEDIDDYDVEREYRNKKKKKKRKNRLLRRMGMLLFLTFCLFLLTLYMTGYWKVLLAKFGSHFITENVHEFTDEELTHQFTIPEIIPEGFVHNKNVINLLLVGIESIGNADPHSGRSDTMMLFSYRLDTGEIRLVSLLRDTYVPIEGHKSNKLNAAYALGKLDLLIPTIQNVYGIFIDGVARVNFDEFETIIDMLGGVDISLTEREAEYLRTTNYISKPEYRNVVAGMNRLNGNQALGYCRIRKVPTILDGVTIANDYGRTARQRKVLTALFERYKASSKTKLYGITKDILSVITCSLSQEQVAYCLDAYLKKPATQLTTLQMPAEGYFRGEVISGVGDCLVPDYEANRAILQHLLYGISLPEGITIQN